MFGTKSLISGAAAAAAIKMAGAALAYLMLVAIAKITTLEAFGWFGVAFSLANAGQYVGLLGQAAAIIRFWPEHSGKNDNTRARGFLRATAAVALLGLLVTASAIFVVGSIVWFFAPNLSQAIIMGAILLLVLGWAEYASSALRSMGSVYLALLPRDIVWRVGTLLIAGIIMWSGKTSDLASIAGIVAGVLVAATIPQTWALVKRASGQVTAEPEDRTTLRRVSGGLWGITALSPLLTQGVTLLVAGVIGPSAAGAFFAAERSALLASVALGGINQVLAPHISKAFHSGRTQEVQRIVAMAAAVGGGAGLIFLLVLLVFGNWLLELFDPTYSSAWGVLIMLAAAQVFNAAAGPTVWLLQVTGRQNAMLKYLLISNVAGAILVLLLSHVAGMIGAAIGISVTVVLWNSMAILDARKHLGIDPSFAGMLRRA